MTLTTRKTMAFTTKLLINGESVDGAGESLAVQNPSTGSTISEVVEATAKQVEAGCAGRPGSLIYFIV